MSTSPPEASTISMDEGSRGSSEPSVSGDENNGRGQKQEQRQEPHKSSQQKGIEKFHHIMESFSQEARNGLIGQGMIGHGHHGGIQLGAQAPAWFPDVATLTQLQARTLAEQRQLEAGRPIQEMLDGRTPPWIVPPPQSCGFPTGPAAFPPRYAQQGAQYRGALCHPGAAYNMNYGGGIPSASTRSISGEANNSIAMALLQGASSRRSRSSTEKNSGSSSSSSSSSSTSGDCMAQNGAAVFKGSFSPHQIGTGSFSPQSSTSGSGSGSGGGFAGSDIVVGNWTTIPDPSSMSSRNSLLEHENQLLRQKLQWDSMEKVNLLHVLLSMQADAGLGGGGGGGIGGSNPSAGDGKISTYSNLQV